MPTRKLSEEERYLIKRGWKQVTSGSIRYLDPETKRDKPMLHAYLIQQDRDKKEREENERMQLEAFLAHDIYDDEQFNKLFPPKEKKNGRKVKSKSGADSAGRPGKKRTKRTATVANPRLLPKRPGHPARRPKKNK